MQWLTAHDDFCMKLRDNILLELLDHVVLWGNEMQHSNFVQALLAPQPKSTVADFLQMTYAGTTGPLKGRAIFQRHGAHRLAALLERRAKESGEGGGVVTGSNGRVQGEGGKTMFMDKHHMLAAEFCEPFIVALVQCSGRRPHLDASSIAVEMAHWSSVGLIRVFVDAGYRLSSIISQVGPDRSEQAPATKNMHPLASSSASFAAAFVGNVGLLELLEAHEPAAATASQTLRLTSSKANFLSQSHMSSVIPFEITARAILPAAKPGDGQEGGVQEPGAEAFRSTISIEGSASTPSVVKRGGGWDDGHEVRLNGYACSVLAYLALVARKG